MTSLNLPADLREFLTAGKRLEYDPERCDPGAVGLLAPDQLALQLFPYHTDSAAMTDEGLNVDDPYRAEDGCYLVEGVNLVATADDYGAVGRLMWFPLEGCYGIWDSDHWHLSVFPPEHTWSVIAADPVRYLNAGWGDLVQDDPPQRPLMPWRRYRYSFRGENAPYPYEENASAHQEEFLRDLTGSWTIFWVHDDPTNRNPIELVQSGDRIEGTYLNDARESCKVTGAIDREKRFVIFTIRGERLDFAIECTGIPASAKVIEGRWYRGDITGTFRMSRTEK